MRPTAPFTGLIVLPQASNNRDWKRADRTGQNRDGGDEGHETGAAKELSNKDRGVALCFRTLDPLKARP
ncbi:hypothetical protein M5K25_008888 [Dendrobium thyrsiflorum]|uniref:Uncharacterized protein n=1 Tax=Dendrobium thyrsiflorum TaxID=117978 RepID=A0ABD0V9M1_DENTH